MIISLICISTIATKTIAKISPVHHFVDAHESTELLREAARRREVATRTEVPMRRMKAERLWKKTKQWCAEHDVPYNYAGAQGMAPF